MCRRLRRRAASPFTDDTDSDLSRVLYRKCIIYTDVQKVDIVKWQNS